MDNLYVSSLIIGAFQKCRNSHYIEAPMTPSMRSIDQHAALKFLMQLDQAYKYQLSLKKEQRPKRKLPPVPKFEESEMDSEPQKKVQILSESKPEVNVFAKSVTVNTHSTTLDEAPVNLKMEEEEEISSNETQDSNDEKAHVLSQMNEIFDKKEKNASTFVRTFDTHPVSGIDKRDLVKFKKLGKCIDALISKLEIKDSDVPVYCREFLQLVMPHLLTHFNKKPFIAIAAAVLIFACYKADYHITTKKIIEASESKETMVVKCFYSIKEIFSSKKN